MESGVLGDDGRQDELLSCLYLNPCQSKNCFYFPIPSASNLQRRVSENE